MGCLLRGTASARSVSSAVGVTLEQAFGLSSIILSKFLSVGGSPLENSRSVSRTGLP